MKTDIPNILYKYRHCNEAHLSPEKIHQSHLNMLKRNAIYFSNPLEFNDPFDCFVHEYLFMFNNNVLTKSLPDLKKKLEIWKPWLNNYIEDKTSVFSLSATNKSILMWSNYADYHKGFCIGFKITSPFDRNAIRKVKYKVKRPLGLAIQALVDPHNMIAPFVDNLIYTKYSAWTYEKEYRMIATKGEKYYEDYNIDHIIFGFKMLEENKQRIREILKYKKINFYQATLDSKKDFSLKIVKVKDLEEKEKQQPIPNILNPNNGKYVFKYNYNFSANKS